MRSDPAICGLAVLAVYACTQAAVRAALSHRWPGTRFVALAWRSWTRSEWVAAPLGVLAIACPAAGVALTALLGVQVGPRTIPGWPWAGPGLAVALAALALMVSAQLSMGRSWRIGVDRTETTPLVTTGLFARTRNPIYAASILLLLGEAITVPAALTLVGLVAAVGFAEWQVRVVEEPYLIEEHGQAYLGWAASAGRFVPCIGRLGALPVPSPT